MHCFYFFYFVILNFISLYTNYNYISQILIGYVECSLWPFYGVAYTKLAWFGLVRKRAGEGRDGEEGRP